MSLFWSAFLFGFFNGLLFWMREYINSPEVNHADQPV